MLVCGVGVGVVLVVMVSQPDICRWGESIYTG